MKKLVTNHIAQMREAEEHKKKVWVIVASTITMLVICGFWLWYISATLPRANVITKNTEVVKTENPSIIQSIIQGIKLTANTVTASVANITQTLTNGIKNTVNYATKEKEIIIKKEKEQKNPFQPNEPEELEAIPLINN